MDFQCTAATATQTDSVSVSVPTTNLNESVSPSAAETAAANNNPPPAPHGRGGPRKSSAHAEDTEPHVACPERRPFHNGGASSSNGVLLEPQLSPANWENLARVVLVMDAVLKVFCVHTEPNFSLPWQRKRQYSSGSSGFIISGRRGLTNAHSMEYYTQVKLKKRASDTKYLATVLAIGNECDIALLTVSDDEFWEGVSPVEFGDLPALQDAVTVVGYPVGGDTISVTSGVVLRMGILSYAHGSTELLGLQIDAAINSGNSGGPAFNDKGKSVGIAFQSFKHEDMENIGYVIPTPVIIHFIQDYEKNGIYAGFPILGVEWQKTENPDFRMAMGMKSDQKGFNLIVFPFWLGECIGFSYLVSQKYTGDTAVVKVLRNSKIFEFNIKLSTQNRLIPVHTNGKPPSYHIIAGFVFTAVTVPYFRSEYGKDYECDAPMNSFLLYPRCLWLTLILDEEIVNTQVLAFNGKPVKNLKSLADMMVVLQTKTARAATSDIITTHCISSAMSDDLKT
ncbi:hypothetical protein SLE2022_279750 [Rubroshorea leprosula]